MAATGYPTIDKHYPENVRIDVFRTLMQNPIQGIPKILSIRGTDDGWVVMEEYIYGQTLAQVMKGGLFTRKKAVAICLELCRILEKLHSFGIVHGDIKPENIIIANSGTLYLIDFDASHFVKNDIGRDTVMMGTPGYASPEQFGFGRSDPRSDIYSIGVLLNVMMTGKHPLYETVAGRISIVVERCTDVDPEKRYQTIKQLESGLKHPARRGEYLPVGFRSGSLGKMIFAIIGYIGGILLIIRLTTPNYSWENETFPLMRGLFIVLYIGTIFIFFNYGGINDIFSKKKESKHIAAKIVEELIFLVILVIIWAVLIPH